MTTTAGTTSRGYRYPGDASATDVPGDLKKLADDVNTDVAAVAADGAVTTAKIAASAVTSAKIADATIVAGDLADGAVTTAKIADSAVTSVKIADDTIVNADINSAAAIDVSKLSGVVATATVGNLLSSAAAACTGGLSLYKYTAAYGSESVTVTATDTVAGWVYNTATVSVTAGKTYTFRVDVTASSGRDWRLSVQWRTGGSSTGGLVSSQVLGVGATGTLSQSIVAPAGVDNVICNIYSSAGSIGDTATFAKFGIWEGVGGVWSLPGTGIKGTYDTLSVVPRSDVGNILPANVATGTGTLSSTDGFYSAGNYTLTSDTAQYYQGTRSLKMVSLGAGSLYLTHGGITTNGTIPVTAGAPYTFSAWAMSDSITKLVSARIYWYAAGGTQISNVAGPISALSPTWQRYAVTATAPANAVTASVMFIGYSIVLGDTLWTDAWSLNTGAGGSWVPPGVPVPGTYDSTLVLPRNEVGNLLTAAQASFEDGGTGNSYFSVSYGTLANSSAQAANGTKCLAVTYTDASANRIVEIAQTAGNRAAVTAGKYYTASVAVRSDQASEQFAPILYSYTSGGASTSVATGTTQTVTNTGWTTLTVTGLIPAGGVTATVGVKRITAGAGPVAYIDKAGIWEGCGGLWALPGTPIANLGTYTDESVGRRVFTWDTVNNRWQMTYGDTGWREINALQTAAALTKFPNAVLSVRRVNSSVDVRWFSDTGTVAGAAGTAICSTLTGFRPGVIQGRGIVGSAVNASSGLPSVHGVYSDGAALNIATTADSANNVLASLSYTTNDSWPTALPGNAIGTIPQ